MRLIKGSRSLLHPCVTVLLMVVMGCGGPDPNGPGSFQALVQAEENAQQTLQSVGAKMERKEYPPGSAWVVNLSGKPLAPEVWTALKGLDRVSELNLSNTSFSDADVPTLNELSGLLIDLNASGTALSDQGLQGLEGGQLRQLDVRNTKVTAEGVASFLKQRKENPKITFKDVQVKR